MTVIAERLSTPIRLRGASLLRVVLGSLVCAFYVLHAPIRDFLWGLQGEIPRATFLRNVAQNHGALNVYLWAHTSTQFQLVFAAGFLVTLLWTLGVRTRLLGPLVFAFTWSLMYRNETLMNGGWRMLLLVLCYLSFADVGRHFSVETALGRGPSRLPRLARRLLALLHNGAIAACLSQVVIMYVFSTFYKLTGHMWQDGTALYYILRSAEFEIPGVSSFIYHSAVLVTLGTYGALALQAAFPWLVFNSRLKWFGLAGAMGFHLGIAFLMGLVWFSVIIISVDLLFIPDATYQAIAMKVRDRWARVGSRGERVAAASGSRA
jgi:hypothetical protein